MYKEWMASLEPLDQKRDTYYKYNIGRFPDVKGRKACAQNARGARELVRLAYSGLPKETEFSWEGRLAAAIEVPL